PTPGRDPAERPANPQPPAAAASRPGTRSMDSPPPNQLTPTGPVKDPTSPDIPTTHPGPPAPPNRRPRPPDPGPPPQSPTRGREGQARAGPAWLRLGEGGTGIVRYVRQEVEAHEANRRVKLTA